MIHIATVHWKSSQWIALQHELFRRYIHVPFKVYGYLTGIESQFYDRFDQILDEGDPSHADKLDALAQTILADARDTDWILFIDGDAFPVAPVVDRIQEMFRSAPLVAIQRLENLGEKHTHPAFCITTVGVWKDLGATWQPGYKWVNALNFAETDVGADLLRALTWNNIPWIPLHRSNVRDILHVNFGIYNDMIYHHGGGFRSDPARSILEAHGVYNTYRRLDARILNNIFSGRRQKQIRNSSLHPEGRLKKQVRKRVSEINNKVTAQLMQDPETFIANLRAGNIDRILT